MQKKKKQQPKQFFVQRKKCNCVAQKHQLINNCLSCGKVVCALQGEGPCLYCGNIVTRPDGNFIVNDQSLFPTMNKQQRQKASQQLSKARLHKNNLVERDKSSSMSQNIYDESIDYYDVSQNQWLDNQSRESAINKLIEKDKYIQQQQFKNRIVFDPLTKQFVTKTFQYDEQNFRNQGKNYMHAEQRKQYENKMKQATKSKMDERVMQNDKVREIVDELKKDKKSDKNDRNNQGKITKNNRVTQMIIQEQTQGQTGLINQSSLDDLSSEKVSQSN